MGYTHTFLQFYHSYSIFNTEATLTDFVCKNIFIQGKLEWDMGIEFYMHANAPQKRTTLHWEAWDENRGDSYRVKG